MTPATAHMLRILAEQRAKCGLSPTVPTTPVRAPRGTGRVGSGKQKSALESKFHDTWTLLGGPPLEREQMIVPGRKWRFDFVRKQALAAVEIHGGVWTGGRHTRGGGFSEDRRKMAAAAELDWAVFELTGGADLSAANVERLIGVVREREAQRVAGA